METVEINLENGTIKHKNKKIHVNGDIMATLRTNGITGIISGNMLYVHIDKADKVFSLFEKTEYKYKELVQIAKEHGIKVRGKKKAQLLKELKEKNII